MAGNTSGAKIKVLIVDDIEETRNNIQKLLYFENDIEIIGTAANGREGVDLALKLQPRYCAHGYQRAGDVWHRGERGNFAPSPWHPSGDDVGARRERLLAPLDACRRARVFDQAILSDSLAEACLVLGRTEDAVRNYKRSLELNPENANAKAALERLGR